MDELEISGKRYISTRRAGKEHGYHSDYIGQLIRGDKVRGQKVGRSWYVDEESLTTYLGKEYVKLATPEPVVAAQAELQEPTHNDPELPEEEIKVEAPVAVQEMLSIQKPPQEEYSVPIKKLVTAAAQTEEEGDEVEQQAHAIKLKYIPDDEPLLPEIVSTVITSRYPEQIYAQEIIMVAPTARRSRRVIKAVVFAGLAGLIIAASALASAYVSSTVRIVGETASIFYSVGE